MYYQMQGKKHFSSDHFPAAYIHPNIYEIWYAKMCFSCWQRNTPPYISLDCLHRSTESEAYCQYYYFDAEDTSLHHHRHNEIHDFGTRAG